MWNQGYQVKKSRSFKLPQLFFALVTLALLLGGGFFVYRNNNQQAPARAVEKHVNFDQSITADEQTMIQEAITTAQITLSADTTAKAVMSDKLKDKNKVLSIFLPVTHFSSVRQKISLEELKDLKTYIPSGTNDVVTSALAESIGLEKENLQQLGSFDELPDDAVAFMQLHDLQPKMKLLRLNDNYYLDAFDSGAIFRETTFEGEGSKDITTVTLMKILSKDDILKVNMTGVTALTRVMQKKLSTVNDPTYFSAKIGDFLADADITHVSNEVSFRDNCPYSNTAFCSPPSFIETLKASGVDLVELTGNHNNDTGSQYNTETITLYHQLGWGTVGGGLNSTEAAKPYVADQKKSKVTFLAYNFADSPNGGAIATSESAGANSFDFDKIKKDIDAAHSASNFVIVDVQYWECYAYPDGFIEFPQCDSPIGEQEQDFKKLIDLGADMVIGTQAHQPQYYELYNGKPIYYGLGNLYFEQTSWPGTERGIILTHYFWEGKFLQTKLTPTIYDTALQTRIASDEQAAYLLTRLQDAAAAN